MSSFECAEWEINLLKRLRALERAGVDHVELDLPRRTIVRKVDTRLEHLDRALPPLQPLTQVPGQA